jgi:hypothetical protein
VGNSALLARLKELDPVAKRVGSESAIEVCNRLGIVLHFETAGSERLYDLPEIGDEKSGMRAFRGTEIRFDTEVQLQRATLEPRAAPRSEIRRFGDFRQAKDLAVKMAHQRFAAGGYRQLNVVDSVNGHLPTPFIFELTTL